MQEKRKFGRIPFGTIVTVVTDNHPHRGVLQDLSLKGALVLLDAPPPATAAPTCQLRLPLSPDLILEFQGVITHIHEKAAGIHFTQTDPESFGHLIRLMELNTGDPEKIHRELHGAD
ncbi:MAG: hypothetical protein A2X84_03545 [Desulfuromonadaceae bacterium GWC2_58_13]|nr:MAG: hypothetical protein A2X84_03545 [Desulfuromonadaceae bacterium GWC2_58_13]